MCLDRNHDEELPTSGDRARDTWKTSFASLKSSLLRARQMPHRAEAYQSLIGGLLFIAGMTRPEISLHVNTGRRVTNPSASNMMAAKGVLRYLRLQRRDYLEKTRKSRTESLCGRILRRKRSPISKRSPDRPRVATDRLVKQETRCSIAVDNQGRIHNGLRRGKRPCPGKATPEGAENPNQPKADTGDR